MSKDMMEEPIMTDETSDKMDEILNAEPEDDDTSTDDMESEDDDVSTETDSEESEDETEESATAEDESSTEEKPVKKTEEKQDPEFKEIEVELDDELVDPQVVKAIRTVTVALNEERKKIAADREELKLEREKAYENRIDSCFDKYADNLPDLGTTSSLTLKSGNYRREIFQHAQITASIRKIPIEDAIADTVQMFANKDGLKKIITQVNNQSTMNKPSRKQAVPVNRKYKSDSEMKRATMTSAFKKAGIT